MFKLFTTLLSLLGWGSKKEEKRHTPKEHDVEGYERNGRKVRGYKRGTKQ